MKISTQILLSSKIHTFQKEQITDGMKQKASKVAQVILTIQNFTTILIIFQMLLRQDIVNFLETGKGLDD